MDIRKNDIVKIKIEDIGTDGEGIGRYEGYTLFVKDAVVGDEILAKVIKMKKNYGYGRLMEIRKPSPYRVKPKCEIARQCGGCQIQALDYKEQLKFKENKIRGHLERIGKFKEIPMEPIIGMEEPFYYRNKAQFPVGKDKSGNPVIGFYAGRTHSIIDTSHCYIQAPVNEKIIAAVREYMAESKAEPYDEENHSGLIRHILTRVGYHTGEIMVSVVINGTELPKQEILIDKLCRIPGMTSITLNINRERTNVILGKKLVLLWGREWIEDYIEDIKYQISPLSFYQVNPKQTEKLYRTALEYAGLNGNEIVWDLYCGIGTISLFLSKKAKKVFGVEIVPEAVEDAKRNAKLNGIENAEFYTGKAEEVLPSMYKKYGEKVRADVVVVDPPRKGCDGVLLDTIVEMGPERIVYVSCDSATLARDLRWLCDRGYEVRKVRGVDLFGMTVHVESVVLMSRVEK